jgi:phospholipase C
LWARVNDQLLHKESRFMTWKHLFRATRPNSTRHIDHRRVPSLEILEDRLQPSGGPPGAQGLAQIDHFVVIYQENWSFDGLYGSFPGANGLANAVDAHGNLLPLYQQVDRAGDQLSTVDPSYAGQNSDPNIPDRLPAKPFDLNQYVPPSGRTADIVHRFYTEQLQIGNGALQPGTGRSNQMVAWSDNPKAVLSHYDATNLPEGLLAQQYALDDNFFQSAYGGSYLNHQFLIAAAAPQWNQLMPAGFQSSWDPASQTLADNNLTIDGQYVVNTTFSANLVPSFVTPGAATLEQSINDSNPDNPNRPFELNIGDRLENAGVSWKWYSGGWNAAVNLQRAYQSGDAAQIAAAKAPFNDPNNPFNLFQWHHQPFAYFDNYAPLSAGGQAHLQDEINFFADLAAGSLPAVSFIKPLGPDNEHPGYTSLLKGQQHVADIVHAVQNSSEWAHTAIIITYDENGGRWDHVAPPQRDEWGDGNRVPAIVISPYAKHGYVDHTQHDTLSILKTIEDRFGLQPLNARDASASSLASNFQLQANPSLGQAYLQPDADNSGQFALIVGGTEDSDQITISQNSGELRVQIDSSQTHFDRYFQGTISRLEVYPQGGNDNVEVAADVTIPAFLFGGAGNHHFQGGGGISVLVGGQGDNELIGGAAASILIGGTGHNLLVGGSGNDILIGGSTTFDANLAALKGLLTEWTRTDATYSQRVAHITGGAAGGKNGDYVLDTTTVWHNDNSNTLISASGGLNLYFARLFGSERDTIEGLHRGEIVIEI